MVLARSSSLSARLTPDLAMLQEEEAEWDFCDVGCPVEAGCPNGWKELQSGCYQVNQGSLSDTPLF